jgi:hypothetical protein
MDRVGGAAGKKYSQLNDRLRVKDKEELTEEIIGLRTHNNIQTEELRMLKTEIGKLRRKLAATASGSGQPQ